MNLSMKQIKTIVLVTIIVPLVLVFVRKLTTLVPVVMIEVPSSTGIQISVTNWVIQFNILTIIDLTTIISLILAFYFATVLASWTRKQMSTVATSEKSKEEGNGIAKIPDLETS